MTKLNANLNPKEAYLRFIQTWKPNNGQPWGSQIESFLQGIKTSWPQSTGWSCRTNCPSVGYEVHKHYIIPTHPDSFKLLEALQNNSLVWNLCVLSSIGRSHILEVVCT